MQNVEIKLDENTLERLAALNHQLYCEDMTAKGYRYGPTRDDDLRTRPLLTDYTNLPEEVKKNNREAVQSIPEKLRAVGCTLSSTRGEEYRLTPADIEILAKMEHRRYLENAVRGGWRYASQYDEDNKYNPTLVPWDTLTPVEARIEYPQIFSHLGPGPLPEKEREKDREPVRNYVNLLHRASLRIVKKHD